MTMTALTTPRRDDRAANRSACKGWLHLCNGLDPRRDGGMVPSILGMTGALAGRGSEVRIVTPTASRLDGTTVPPGVSLYGPDSDLEAAVRAADVVHLHGLWQGHTRRGARAARAARVPYLIAAHGMAEPWAMRHKRLKKKVYTALVEGRNLRLASCLHALSRPEVEHLRNLAPGAPICLAPNGVDLDKFEDLPDRREFESEHPEVIGKTLILFFGRLHAKKGLDLLAEAFEALSRDHHDAHLLIAGNDDGALGPFRDRVVAAGLMDRVSILGHLSGESARRAWGAADAFVLPSYSEGFSMAVLEALARRLPALITTACHFPELAETGGGIVVEPTPLGVSRGLRQLLESSDSERKSLGRRGRALVEARYTWQKQAGRLADVYRWLVGGGNRPEAVVD